MTSAGAFEREPESLMYAWNEYLMEAAFGLAPDAGERKPTPRTLGEFGDLMRRSRVFFRDHPLRSLTASGDTQADAYGPYGVYLGIYSMVRAYSNTGCTAADLYDRRFRYLGDLSEDYWREEGGPWLLYVATTIAARCLCREVELGNALKSPVLSCEIQTFGGEVLPSWRRAGMREGGEADLLEGERCLEFEYDADKGDLDGILGRLRSLHYNEFLYPY